MPSEKIKYLVIRANSGIAGDIICAGLASLANYNIADFNKILKNLNLESLNNKINLISKEVNHIAGVTLNLNLPIEKTHRNLNDIKNIIEKSQISENVKKLSLKTFTILAEAEAKVHNCLIEELHFHEVGALDSIIDIIVSLVIFEELNINKVICSPLPISDGEINCAHGLLSSPAPAVLHLLENVPIYGVPNSGETVTPTGLALLKALKTEFNTWPKMYIEKQAIIYGQKTFQHIPNGAVFALGSNY